MSVDQPKKQTHPKGFFHADGKVPHEWRWTLWERPRVGVGDWQEIYTHSQESVCKVRDLLTRCQPTLEFQVCRPGAFPAIKAVIV